MTYHATAPSRPRAPRVWRAPGLGQDATFTLAETEYRTAHPTATDAEVAAAIATPSTTSSTTTSTPSKSTSTSSVLPTWSAPATGKSGGSSTPITSAVYSAPIASGTSSSGMPSWAPWAIGGTVAVLGIGLLFAARG